MAGRSSPEAMENMINVITKFIDVQQNVIEKLKSDYQVVGEEWDDKQYQNLGNAINTAISSISGTYSTLSETTTRLQLLKGKLEEYLNQQM